MQVSVSTRAISETRCDLVVVPMRQLDPDRRRLPPSLAAFDRAHGGAIATAIDCGDFAGRRDQLSLVYPSGRGAPARVLLVGLGEQREIDAESLRRAAGSALKRAAQQKVKSVAIALPKLRGLRPQEITRFLVEGAVLGSYRFDKYRESRDSDPKPPRTLSILVEGTAEPSALRQAARTATIVAESQNLARDLSNEPPNELPPTAMATAARRIARQAGLRCKVLDVPQMKKLGMGAILAVGQGSANPPRMIVLEYEPKRRTRRTPTICLVGKGVTFDTGGISIKPALNMHEMKHDMSGAAAVLGTLRAVGLLGLPLHVVGVIGAAENMPGGSAYRPGDVIRAMSGKTIEILNTDAEGRVVLADALHYAVSQYEPDALIDLATLTGACMVALGPWATGAFSRDDDLSAELVRAGEATGERIWPLPLFDEHVREMHSAVADLKNAGSREAGASTAAGFLSAFVGDTPWAHLDIAGTGWASKNTGYTLVGATGVGVRVLLEWLDGRTRKRV